MSNLDYELEKKRNQEHRQILEESENKKIKLAQKLLESSELTRIEQKAIGIVSNQFQIDLLERDLFQRTIIQSLILLDSEERKMYIFGQLCSKIKEIEGEKLEIPEFKFLNLFLPEDFFEKQKIIQKYIFESGLSILHINRPRKPTIIKSLIPVPGYIGNGFSEKELKIYNLLLKSKFIRNNFPDPHKVNFAYITAGSFFLTPAMLIIFAIIHSATHNKIESASLEFLVNSMLCTVLFFFSIFCYGFFCREYDNKKVDEYLNNQVNEQENKYESDRNEYIKIINKHRLDLSIVLENYFNEIVEYSIPNDNKILAIQYCEKFILPLIIQKQSFLPEKEKLSKEYVISKLVNSETLSRFEYLKNNSKIISNKLAQKICTLTEELKYPEN